MSRKQIEVGSLVVLKVDKVPYYSGYGGNPEVLIKAGDVGQVVAVDVPRVCESTDRDHPAPPTFHCVDFVREEFQGDPTHGNHTWRVSAYSHEVTLADPALATLAEHAEAWCSEQGRLVPNRDSSAWARMYSLWNKFAF